MRSTMKVLSLFSGIGGMDLGLSWAGFETVAFCENDEFCRKVLAKHWPGVPIHEDIENLTADTAGNLWYIDQNGQVIGSGMSRKRSPKYDDAVALYTKGMSIGDCAEFYGITRQAMHQILQRRGCVFRPNLRYGTDNHFHRGGKVTGQKRASHMVEKAIKKGLLKEKTHCECCGNTKEFADGRSGIQAHHDDYNKPLDVRWLCQECHHDWHKNNTAKGTGSEPAADIDVVCGGFP